VTVRNLDRLFRPRSVAVIGASPRERSIGFLVLRNLLAGGFAGSITPVNPKHQEIQGLRVVPDVAALSEAPDLAVLCTPPPSIPGLIAELGGRGTKGAIILAAGFKELGSAEGRALEAAALAAAKPHLMRIIGPNCVGAMVTSSALNASFAHMAPNRGTLSFVTQSGAMATTILDWASAKDLGFSHLVSLGDMLDVDFGDMLDYLAGDPETRAILLYLETVTNARKFMSAARAASRMKPVIAIKAGRHAAAARAAASHTGALAGSDAVYDAAFRRAGILRVTHLGELFDAAEMLSAPMLITGDRLAIVTNGGGAGVLATDALMDEGGTLAELSADTMRQLDHCLPSTWSHGNPVDVIGDADAARYDEALGALLAAPEVDAVLVMNCPTAVASGLEAAEATVRHAVRTRRVVTNWLGSDSALPARAVFEAAHVPTFETPDAAVRGLMQLIRHRRRQAMLMELPSSTAEGFVPDEAVARGLIEAAIAEGRTWLEPTEVSRLLACYRIEMPRSATVSDAAAAAAKAREFKCPVALKIVSPDILHKTDAGGVALDVVPEAVGAAAEAMLARVEAQRPEARIAGFLVQEMIHRPRDFELIMGMSVDAQFGPVLLVGQGGTGVEVIGDKALGLPPLNHSLAMTMIEQTRIYRQLRGYRDRPAADCDAVAEVLVRLSQLVCDLDAVSEIDLNPVLAGPSGVIAVDARIRVVSPTAGIDRRGRLAISAYPRELEREVTLPGIGAAVLRPIRPDDASELRALFDALSPEDVRLRFFHPLGSLSEEQVARFTQIDYDREMAFVLEAGRVLLGVARLMADPDRERAEFAVTVRSALKGRGIGRLLMQHLIDYARQRNIGKVFGEILPENALMIALAQELGFRLDRSGDGAWRHASLNLRTGRNGVS
jgi:acetyltransferase